MTVPGILLHMLHIGRQFTGFTVCPDAVWPGMWRIHAPPEPSSKDGRDTARRGSVVSDMVNLPWAKDAAVAWARPRGLGGGEKVHWCREYRETAAIATSMRSNEAPAKRAEWLSYPCIPDGPDGSE
jgi:hypothetical protein